jgi:hypothetical protein
MGASEGDDSEHRFCEGTQQMFDQFPEYYMNILLRDFNAQLNRYDIFKQMTGNKMQQHWSSKLWSKNLSQAHCSQHQNTPTYTLTF